MKILLLEDELHLRQNIKKFLTLKGYEVDDFENGAILLDNANPNDYDCMILDVNTPEVDGFEVLEYIRNNKILTPAIFISALTDVQKVLKAFEIGAEDYLKKPFDLAELEVRMLRATAKLLTKNQVKINEFHNYDLQNRTLLKNGLPCKLSSTQHKFLYLIMKNQNKNLKKKTLEILTAHEIGHSVGLVSRIDNNSWNSASSMYKKHHCNGEKEACLV